MDVAKWKKMVAKLNGNTYKNQYRIPDRDITTFRSYFQIKAIPRYVVLDRSGKIVANEFLRPTDVNFKKVLDEMLLSLN